MSVLTVPQPIYPLSYHLHAIFQFRQIAVPTLMISTYVGGVLAIYAANWLNPMIDQLAKTFFSRRIQHTTLFKYSVKGAKVLAGILILAGVNIGASKLFNLPFSRLSSFGITIMAIAIPSLAIAGVNYAAQRYLQSGGRFGNYNRFNSTSLSTGSRGFNSRPSSNVRRSMFDVVGSSLFTSSSPSSGRNWNPSAWSEDFEDYPYQ